MKQTLNLDKGFAPFGESSIKATIIEFPSGIEPHIKITECSAHKSDPVIITCRVRSMNDIVLLALANDALKRLGFTDISCFIPYLPFARQDRVMVSGEPLSIKVISDIINLQGFKNVYLFDVHSDVSMALINNSKSISNVEFVKYCLVNAPETYYIVSPDAGAYKKVFNLCQSIGYKGQIAVCNKVRDVSSGQIIKTNVDVADFQGKDVYIIDDICDGGATFINLAVELSMRNCGKINLIVSHGIFSKGLDPILQHIDHIYTTDSFKYLISQQKLTQYNLSLTW
jgi:ribose-phosphate pyrophosphokinase